MKYWCCDRNDLKTIVVPEYGDLAVILKGNQVFRYGEDDLWHRDLYDEEELKPELDATDAAYRELNEGN